jgi:hypothetical protein
MMFNAVRHDDRLVRGGAGHGTHAQLRVYPDLVQQSVLHDRYPHTEKPSYVPTYPPTHPVNDCKDQG